jgi:membrane-associated protein
MELIATFFETVYNVPALIRAAGHLGLPLIIFAETGLFIGFFLPGDSLLVTAGLFAAKGDLDLGLMLVTLIPAAIVGDAVGYWIGKRTGTALYSRKDSFFFRQEHVRITRAYYEKHGPITIVLARFIPIVRTFAPMVAGVAEMGYTRFATYNVLGGVIWIISTAVGGYWLGSVVPNIEQQIHYLVAGVIVVSLIPPVIAWWRNRSAATPPTP